MKKIITTLLILVLLVGCRVNPENFESKMQEAITQVLQVNPAAHTNQQKATFAYYLPVSVGVIESNNNASLLSYDIYEIVMNLNVAAIISEKYYQQQRHRLFTDDTEYLYNQQGQYKDYKGQVFDYNVTVFNVGDGKNYMFIETGYLTYLVNASMAALPELAQVILSMARTVSVDNERVIKLYSRKIELKDAQVTNKEEKTSGYLIEMIEGHDYEFDWSNYTGDELITEQEAPNNDALSPTEPDDSIYDER